MSHSPLPEKIDKEAVQQEICLREHVGMKNQRDPNEISPDEKANILGEKKRVEKRGRIRQFVFGSMDGLLVPLGVVSGVAGGTGSTKAVVIAGIAEAFAGALSMGAGEFLSGRAEAQVQQAEIREEKLSIRENPQFELEEMALLLEHEGIKMPDAHIIAEKLQKSPSAFFRTMIQKELGLDPEPKTVRFAEGVTIGVSYLIGSLVPLMPYFLLKIPAALPTSIGVTFLVLAGVGVIRGTLARIGLLRSALEVLAVGVLTGGGGYLLGTFLPSLFGY
jgi:VIT1/CCC1 family predicted Fe2+/Mn2+ transporter